MSPSDWHEIPGSTNRIQVEIQTSPNVTALVHWKHPPTPQDKAAASACLANLLAARATAREEARKLLLEERRDA